MRFEDVIFILCVCAIAFYVATVIKFKEQGAGVFFGVIFSPVIPFVMVLALYVTFPKLYREFIKGLPMKEQFVWTVRLIRAIFSSIPIQHTVCIAFVCDVLRENRRDAATQNNSLSGRLYADIESLVMT